MPQCKVNAVGNIDWRGGGIEAVSLVFRSNLTQNILKGKRNQRLIPRRDIHRKKANKSNFNQLIITLLTIILLIRIKDYITY